MAHHERIDSRNITKVPSLLKRLLNDDHVKFLSFDCEFTGLGEGIKNTRSQLIPERYDALKLVADQFAIVSFGISIVLQDCNDWKSYNFEFSIIPPGPFTSNPSSLQFLLSNGLNINDWILYGISHESLQPTIKVLLSSLKKVPLVIHNGLLDMIFFYRSFVGELPQALPSFIADLTILFPAGIYDTKFISDFIIREERSFLAYCILYHKYDRLRGEKGPMIRSLVLSKNDLLVNKKIPVQKSGVCKQYGMHGYCKEGVLCASSHDINDVLDEEEMEISKKSSKIDEPRSSADLKIVPNTNKRALDELKRPFDETKVMKIDSNGNDVNNEFSVSENMENRNAHSSYFDAYMTASVFCYQMQLYPDEWCDEWRNRIYLIGKPMPLLVIKSQYSNPSSTATSLVDQLK